MSTGVTLYELPFGRHPPPMIRWVDNPLDDEFAAATVKTREEVLELARNNLLKERERMKSIADAGRKDTTFDIGDKVLVKLQKYRQNSLAKRRSNKLERWYFGPYTITERIGEVAYLQELESTSPCWNNSWKDRPQQIPHSQKIFSSLRTNRFLRGWELIRTV